MVPYINKNKEKISDFIPGKLYYIQYKGFGIPIALHEKVVLCLDTIKHKNMWGKNMHKVTVLIGDKIHDLWEHSYKKKNLSD